ncbi:MAG: hypothetical protein LBD76_02555 [Prevotellaceae bacterium]|jgi:hypothetical protein|nr:hypothetical protein [Prevotellaceae bacterium]
MKYKLIRRVNPQDRNRQKLYAAPVNDGTVNTKSNLAKKITAISLLSIGKSVNCGAFRFSFGSERANDNAGFNVGKINGKKIIFTPAGIELKKHLSDIHFELDSSGYLKYYSYENTVF